MEEWRRKLQFLATLTGDELRLSTFRGELHDRINIELEDPVRAVRRLQAAVTLKRGMWSTAELDEVLERHGYARWGGWKELDSGPTALVTL